MHKEHYDGVQKKLTSSANDKKLGAAHKYIEREAWNLKSWKTGKIIRILPPNSGSD